MDAREHAERAASLLAGVDRLEAHVESLDEQQRLELVVAGGIARVNADLRYSLDVAIAHALTALALWTTETR
jgi:predicted hotdog family 3-hydroxylacyl-ACP dehydratase